MVAEMSLLVTFTLYLILLTHPAPNAGWQMEVLIALMDLWVSESVWQYILPLEQHFLHSEPSPGSAKVIGSSATNFNGIRIWICVYRYKITCYCKFGKQELN